MIRKDAVAQINEHYSEKIYYLTKDKKVSNTETFKKGCSFGFTWNRLLRW
ncbi:hypothetical protein LEP1GSC116_0925 [Leptospira interrogans serovar Icterohaemorrhagiae str. Verdun HP]|uniref:Uncharacterized protein n=1 Tax=Leptospira interrogans serovar Icterohaemorrhagiae str. Verdun HP TaxID=1049910 RepID=M6R8E4_LEPIR|nr:hypothetical protein LEP1GSC116_0925 [Leptospira interrogans serovar Icterohaemorrhagiae str. Verdun HP]